MPALLGKQLGPAMVWRALLPVSANFMKLIHNPEYANAEFEEVFFDPGGKEIQVPFGAGRYHTVEDGLKNVNAIPPYIWVDNSTSQSPVS